MTKIINLLRIGVKIYRYSSKYQVLIVNAAVKGENDVRQSTEGGTNEHYLMGMEKESQNQSRKKIPNRISRKDKSISFSKRKE